MNESGVFGRFLPDFGWIVAMMQFDMYHSYTVDEHTLKAIGILHDIERGASRDGTRCYRGNARNRIKASALCRNFAA